MERCRKLWTSGLGALLLAAPAAAQVCGASVQLDEDFSGGVLPAGWSASGLWHVSDACVPAGASVAGPHLYWGVDAQCDYDSPVLQGTLTSPWFTLPALPNGGLVWLEFAVDLAWEGSPESLLVSLETAGGAQHLVFAPDSGSVSGVQLHEIGYLAGETLRVVCAFDAYDGFANGYLGAKLDAFSVRTFDGGLEDCNANLVPDACDIAGGTSEDCDGDRVPDECQGSIFAFCTTSPNSVGAGARVSAIGRPILSCNAFGLRAQDAPPGELGMFLCSTQAAAPYPYGDGVLCLAPPLGRLVPAVIDAQGACAARVDVDDVSGLGPVAAGSTMHFQFVYRDLASAGAGFNASDGLFAQFVP